MEGVVLVVAPHPDDAEIGMGGTVAKLINEGVKVVVVDLTNGEPTPHGSIEIRAHETANATKILKIKERHLLNLKNRELFDTVENRRALATLIREVKPSVIFAPYWIDAHPDHVEASKLVDAARFYGKFVKTDLPFEPHHTPRIFYYFPLHLKARFAPSFVVDISETISTKMESIRAYKSQFVDHVGNSEKASSIEREALYWGDQVGVRAGEPILCKESIRVSSASTLLKL